jgi:glycosyltransferase involved in cell wall biosynthesis
MWGERRQTLREPLLAEQVHRGPAGIGGPLRIAVANWSNRLVGGVEDYLSEVIPALADAGHDIALFYETDVPRTRDAIPLPHSARSWSVGQLGLAGAIEALRDWGPDVIYSHKLESPRVEARLLEIAPSVFFAHDYYGACISGLKTFKFPSPTPCHRRFGPACLLYYFPRRCGGLSPLTMIGLYRLQSARLGLLRRYGCIVTHSERMRNEYLALGFPRDRVVRFAYYVESGDNANANPASVNPPRRVREASKPYRLLFMARMDLLKGGHYLLQALRAIAGSLSVPVEVVFAGDGPARRKWEKLGRTVTREHPDIRVTFTGWVRPAAHTALLSSVDLLVMPSLWPEPFGRVGPEAGLWGVPAVGYAVGGISEWLQDGINGYLAPGDPPTPEGLGQALLRFLENPGLHAALSAGAIAVARRFSVRRHIESLLAVLSRVGSNRQAAQVLTSGKVPRESVHRSPE